MITEVKIGYVILHYQAINETFACIESLKKITNEKDIIIVIDNNSPNDSGKVLFQKFQNDNSVVVILNSENLGFARGNNIGYSEAKYRYQCDFIVMLNNDTLVLQNDFRNQIISAYNKYQFAVMGPKILQKDGKVNPCSPIIPVHTNIRRARIGQVSNLIRFFLSFFNLDIWFGQMVDKPSDRKDKTADYSDNVQLAGCCLIFSKEYIERFEGLNPDTFMYLEEIILYIRVRNAGLKMIYNPDIEIVHLEDAATLAAFKGKSRIARRFKYRCQINSFHVLIQELKGYKS